MLLSLLRGRIFDPLSWVTPVTITAKIIHQLLWLKKVVWDEPLTGKLLQRLGYHAQLSELSEVSIPRWTGQKNESQNIEIRVSQMLPIQLMLLLYICVLNQFWVQYKFPCYTLRIRSHHSRFKMCSGLNYVQQYCLYEPWSLC